MTFTHFNVSLDAHAPRMLSSFTRKSQRAVSMLLSLIASASKPVHMLVINRAVLE